MSKRSDGNSLEQYARFADALIEAASKDELASCARLLALGLAHYRVTYGDLPEVESLLFTESETTSPANASAMAEGMKVLVSALARISHRAPSRGVGGARVYKARDRPGAEA